MKARRWKSRILLRCPGCAGALGEDYAIKAVLVEGDSRAWQFNGDLEAPTLRPSILLRRPGIEGVPPYVCHSWVTEGRIEFLSDSTHSLAGQTVDLPELGEVPYE